jgi:hypothetical protein
MENSLANKLLKMDRIHAAVKKVGICVVLSYSERTDGSLYIAQVAALCSHSTSNSVLVFHRHEWYNCPALPQDQAHSRRGLHLG